MTSSHATSNAIPHFEKIAGFPAYPWQERAYAALLTGDIPRALTLPTGTGKTSFVLLYLLALSAGAPLPRRIAYVVDRRAIVDQAAEQISTWAQALSEVPAVRDALASMAAFQRTDGSVVEVGSLRGGLLDTGEWRLDPAKPAVLVGTVDMVGSRLLFSGYGDGRSRRALHAGLLGCDTTVVLDEAHLSPAFAATLRAAEQWRPSAAAAAFRTVTMSATPREGAPDAQGQAPSAVSLNETDASHDTLGPRIRAAKYPLIDRVTSRSERRRQMVQRAIAHEQGTVLVYTSSAQEAQKIHKELVAALGRGGDKRVGLLTGTLRGAEREQLRKSNLWQRFADPDYAAGSTSESVFLVATAAGEVGIDLDADHAVIDLVPLDSLIQRLGRINRRGRCANSSIAIVYCDEDVAYKRDSAAWKDRWAAACQNTLELLQDLERLTPQDLQGLDTEAIARASSPQPRIIGLDETRLELLTATSAQLTRPPVSVYLRGISDERDPAEVHVLWRHDVATLLAHGERAAEEALAMLPPRPREVLKLPAYQAETELVRLADRGGSFTCLRIGPDGAASTLTIEAQDRRLAGILAYSTLVLPSDLGGLSAAGFLDASSSGHPVADLADDDDGMRYQQSADEATPGDPPWLTRAVHWQLALHDPTDEMAEPRWWIYARRRAGDLALDAESDLSRLARADEPLDDHNTRVAQAARRIGQALGLDARLVAALETAGAYHDVGKACVIWQRAAGNRSTQPLAKSRSGRFRPALLGGYRHEFGSLVRAERDWSAAGSDGEIDRDLALHLVAAHHGHARPGFPHRRQWDPEQADEQCEMLARAVERRYARLQARYGPWGLAWLEALLKCADCWVSSGYGLEGGDSG